MGVTAAAAGSVLVVDVGPVPELGYWGEVLTTAAEARGLAGLVIDGCVRDVAALEAHHFPVFATGIALSGATKTRPGAVGAPAPVGGVEVAPGDWVVGDADGVTVIGAGEPRPRPRRGPGAGRQGSRAFHRAAARRHDGRAARPRHLADRAAGGLTGQAAATGGRRSRHGHAASSWLATRSSTSSRP